ncbi:MAG: hypothetical protein CAPSK01_001604 [Candidatus Accumulibacter vicinus]|uniref:Uncharacterized protein n=1 Tax=Candidatus Accumulibacter vicinus TaxID=2954382 RepID=A0A084Y206_9PROT|nr:MAG: hypothetical protein CAPSK01_001604 [Candidatus Accumulibacter vicinus]
MRPASKLTAKWDVRAMAGVLDLTEVFQFVDDGFDEESLP